MLPLSLTSCRSPNSLVNPHTLSTAHYPTSFFRVLLFACFSYFLSLFYEGLKCLITLSIGCSKDLRGGLMLFLFHGFTSPLLFLISVVSLFIADIAACPPWLLSVPFLIMVARF